MPGFKVLIAGAGLGGLTLAQSLRAAGIDVRVFERDKTPWDRPQGYRLHLDADALNALHEVLPPELWAVFDATAQRTAPFTTILNPDLSILKRLPTPDEHDPTLWGGAEQGTGHANVDRATLRQSLLAGLEDVVEFEKRLDRYDSRLAARRALRRHWAPQAGGEIARCHESRPGLDRFPGTFFVPGRLAGGPAGLEEAAPYARWLRQRHAEGATLTANCAGTFLLAATGLLSGRPATTHWNIAHASVTAFRT